MMKWSESKLAQGASTGLIIGGLLAVLLIVLRTMDDSGFGLPPGVTYAEMIFIYLFAGLSGGMIFGLLLPLARNLIGCIILGIFVVSPLMLAPTLLGEGQFYDAILKILFFGVLGGYFGWYEHLKDR